MLNKILKIFFLFYLILLSTSVLATSYDSQNMLIDVSNLNEQDGDDYPKLLTKSPVVSGNGNLVRLGASFYNTGYLEVANPVLSGFFSKDDNAPIFILDNTSESYGYTIYVEPTYTSDEVNPASKSGYPQNIWYYPENVQGQKFKAQFIGATITVNIYALKEQKSGVVSIPRQKIAYLHTKTYRSETNESTLNLTSEIEIGSFNVIPAVNTCKITPSDAHVINMKPVSIKDFSSIGSEIDGGGETTITLSCSRGATSVKVGLTDITERNNTSNQLKLDPKSTALGFAVTLYRDNGNIITYNPDPKTGNNTWELSPSTSSSNSVNYNVPIKAKYYRVGSIISPGTILANAAITFIYE